MKYNYVLFNSQDGTTWKDFPDGYYNICVEELKREKGIEVVTAPLYYQCRMIRYLFAAHSSPALAQKVNLPFKRWWYPFYFKNGFEEKKPIAFIILNHHIPLDYLTYLKSRWPDCKIVLLHRDLMAVCQRTSPGLLNNPNIDLEMTFDKGEAAKYGFPHFNEFESKIDIPVLDTPESDVYFAGKGKDRLPLLLDAYQRFTTLGLHCKYYLTGVHVEQQVQLPGIEYANRFMSYREMLYHTVNTRFVLEVNQGGADGYTSRFLEAVMYNKKLITNNSFIKNSPFYNPKSILIFNKAEEISSSFVENSDNVDFHYNGEFSPMRMIERVEEELIKKYGN